MGILAANPIQRGFGLGGLLRGLSSVFKPLIRWFSGGNRVGKAADILRKVAAHPITKKSVRKAKKHFAKSALNVVSDITQGKNVVQSVKQRGKEGLKNIGRESIKDILPAVIKSAKSKISRKRKRNIFD
jgi:hypothetical protein